MLGKILNPIWKIVDRLKFSFMGQSVKVIRVSDIDKTTGRIGSIQPLGRIKKRDNSLVQKWDSRAWEIHGGPINILDENTGEGETGYAVSEAGETVNLYTDPSKYPNRESILGKAATMDDISDAMDLGKDMKRLVLGALLSAPIWWFLFTALGVIAS